MPEKQTIERARRDLRQGMSPSTAAGEFVREEIHHVREGKHGAKSTEQAIAIGLSKARRSGVPLWPPKSKNASAKTRESAKRDLEAGQMRRKKTSTSTKRSRSASEALKHEPRQAASHKSLSRQAKRSAASRTPSQRSAAAKKAAQTKGSTARKAAARKGSRTRTRS